MEMGLMLFKDVCHSGRPLDTILADKGRGFPLSLRLFVFLFQYSDNGLVASGGLIHRNFYLCSYRQEEIYT